MKLDALLKEIFPSGCSYSVTENVVYGEAQLGTQPIKILGTDNDTQFGVKEAILMARHVIDIVKEGKKTPIFMPVDVLGQKLSMEDEWLGMNQYFAHLLEALEVARQSGHHLISLIYHQAIGGAFIAFAMTCDRIYALPEAKVAVMLLEGMSAVTKIPLARLEELSRTSPIFTPGIESFASLAGIHEILRIEEVHGVIIRDIAAERSGDDRTRLGFERGGRLCAEPVTMEILSAE